jgi:homoserine/homoserine lactone efflux protein
MSVQAWLLFCATETVLCFTPGPAVLLVVSLSLTRGPRAGLVGSLGVLTANVFYFALSATSLGAILVTSWELFSLVKWMGAAYLIWLGIRMIARTPSALPARNGAASTAEFARGSFSLAVLTQGANPKALIFFTAILPQFIDPRAHVGYQVALLGISSVVIEFAVLAIYVLTCRRARAWVRQPRFIAPVQRAGGALLIAAGTRLAAIRRA